MTVGRYAATWLHYNCGSGGRGSKSIHHRLIYIRTSTTDQRSCQLMVEVKCRAIIITRRDKRSTGTTVHVETSHPAKSLFEIVDREVG